MAQRVGFEPTTPVQYAAFECGTLNHSALVGRPKPEGATSCCKPEIPVALPMIRT